MLIIGYDPSSASQGELLQPHLSGDRIIRRSIVVRDQPLAGKSME
jgi:hypothetical protein